MSSDERTLPRAAPLHDAGRIEPVLGQRPIELTEAEYQEARPRQLRDYLRVIYKHRWLAALCVIGTVALAIGLTRMTTPQYMASTRIQVARDLPIKLQLKDNVLNLDETDRILNGASSFQGTQVEALKSRDLAEHVLRTFHLAASPVFLEPGSDGGTLTAMGAALPAVLRPRGLDATAEVAAADGATDAGAIETKSLDRYMKYLDVQDVRGTDLIEIQFTTPSPVLSAFLAAAHTTAYLDASQRTQLATDSTAMQFLDHQLQQSRNSVERTDAALNQFAAEHPSVAVNQEHELIGRQIGELSSLVTGAEGKRVNAQTRYEFLAKAKNEPLDHLFDGSTAIRKLRLALLDVEGQRAILKTRLGPNHAQMAELRRQAAEINYQLQNEIEQEIAAARARFMATKGHEDQLRKRLADLEGTASEVRKLGGRYDFLKGELEAARALHESLLKQKTETGVHSELNASKVRVIERPEVPRRPIKPRPVFNLFVGLVAGLLLAGAAIVVREGLDHSVKSSDEVEELLQLPTLAIIPKFAQSRRPTSLRSLANIRRLRAVPTAVRQGGTAGAAHPDLVVVNEPWSAGAEAFRGLRTAVLFSLPAEPPHVILVTSPADGEGKTVTALNLATTLADAGWRVLLVDADLRDPSCHVALDVDNRRGLSTVLTGQADIDGTIHELTAPRLSFLAAGPMPVRPSELLGSGRMSAVMQRARSTHDFVIVDSPPVLAVTDAVVLARMVDGVVLVMRGQDSPRQLACRTRDQLRHAAARVLGVVINNVDLRWGDYHVYSRYEGYRKQPPVAEERSA